MIINVTDVATILGVLIAFVTLVGMITGAVRKVIQYELRPVHYELKMNSGNSVKDQVLALRDWTSRTDVQLEAIQSNQRSLQEFAKYQHGKNHDIIGHLTVLRGYHDVQALVADANRTLLDTPRTRPETD